TITDSRINGTGLNGVEFGPAWFIRVTFDSYALFIKSRFTGTLGGGYAVHFQDCRFGGLTDFSSAVFEVGPDTAVHFERARFEDSTDFTGARFRCHAVFSDIVFTGVTDFIDTSFELVTSAARYVGAAVEFNRITVASTGLVTFLSSDPAKKLFDHDVSMTFTEDTAGVVRFENVNLAHFTPAARARLMEMARAGTVEIGPGCIKYRLQTEVRTVPVEPENAGLVVELCQTFTSYFTASHGLNLGFEIVARDRAKISFFYFSDEDIPYAVFLERLAQTEGSLWNLLSVGSPAQLLALAVRGQTIEARGESVLINAVDGLSALLGTFIRVGARIALGRWQAADTFALLGAIQFHGDGAELRAASLHRTLVDRYTGTTLVDLNRGQNALLPPIPAAQQTPLALGRVRILFLGANSTVDPLDLEREVSRIDTQLKLAREREAELKQVWAVTIDALIQALLDEQPAIVHFSGRGTESGIMLRDEVGAPRKVSGEALAKLFELFKETVRCVVLNSCYSEVQATAIRRHIPFVVGIRSARTDAAAVAFSTGFYTAIAAGKDIPFAFEMGKTRIRMEGTGGEDLVMLR
ncbi:MAG TPA: CHAT domain-containing protein, partial [Longimicrobiaceae bacterium]|nr:CHAT domain-containing protein [Longimicrobiaceae bacterium]